MPRLHLFEIEDQAWLPTSIRDGMTDYMRFLEEFLNLYGVIVAKILRVIRRSENRNVIDLCSGSGGAWEGILKRLGRKRTRGLTIHLTDRFPNLDGLTNMDQAFEGNIQRCPTPVDAMNPPDDLKGCLTLFSALHHFRPAEARQILAQAARQSSGIGVFEMSQRHPLYFLFMLSAPIQVLLLTPFIRPFRFSRIFWTYVIPAIPLFIFMDGIVSGLRTYSLKEMRQLLDEIPGNRFRWEMGIARYKFLPVGITWLIGYPVTRNNPKPQAEDVDQIPIHVSPATEAVFAR